MDFIKSLNEAKLHSHINFEGLNISVEVPANGFRRGVNKKTGEPWAVKVPDHYGYIKGTHSPDGEHLDCYLKKNPKKGSKVYVIHQLTVDGSKFDEDKVMLGYDTKSQAIKAFKEVTFKPNTMFGGCTEFEMEHFQVMAFSASNSTAILTNNDTYQDFKKKKLLKPGIKSPLMVAMSVSESLEMGLQEISEVLIKFNVEESDEFNADLDYDGPVISYEDQDVAERAIRFAGDNKLSVEYGETPYDIVFIDLNDFEIFLELTDIHGQHELAGNMRDAVNSVHRESPEVNIVDLEDSFLEEEPVMEANNFVVVVHTQIMENIGSTEQPSWATAGTKTILVQEGFANYGSARSVASQVAAGVIPVNLSEGAYVLGVDVMPIGEYRQFHEDDNAEPVEEVVDETTGEVFFQQQIMEAQRLAGVQLGSAPVSATPTVHETRARLEALSKGYFDAVREQNKAEDLKRYGTTNKTLTDGQIAYALRVAGSTLKNNPRANVNDVMKKVCDRLHGIPGLDEELIKRAVSEYGSLEEFVFAAKNDLPPKPK